MILKLNIKFILSAIFYFWKLSHTNKPIWTVPICTEPRNVKTFKYLGLEFSKWSLPYDSRLSSANSGPSWSYSKRVANLELTSPTFCPYGELLVRLYFYPVVFPSLIERPSGPELSEFTSELYYFTKK